MLGKDVWSLKAQCKSSAEMADPGTEWIKPLSRLISYLKCLLLVNRGSVTRLWDEYINVLFHSRSSPE